MKNKKSWTLFFCLIVVIMVWMVGCSKEESTTPPSEEPAQQEDEEALEGTATTLGSLKSFSAESLEGEAFSEEEIQGKDVTIINFWALTCPPCIAEMPELAALEKALPENVQLITVCLDGAGDKESTKSILEDAGFEGVTLITGDGDLGSLFGCYSDLRICPEPDGAEICEGSSPGGGGRGGADRESDALPGCRRGCDSAESAYS